LKKKFEGLSRGVKRYILAKGKFSHKKIWGAEFYLLPPSFFWVLAPKLGFWLCLTKKIDVIVCQGPLLEGLLGTILKRLLRKELIVEIHGDWQEGPFLSKKRRLEFIQRRFTPLLAKISFKNADKIRGVASNLIDEAKKIASNKQYFIFPTFTDLDDFIDEKNTEFQDFILFVGHIQKVKGLEYLIRAFDRIKGDFPNFKLVLVGGGQKPENLEMNDRIDYRGRLSLKETKNIMKNCYCLVLPSLSEGLPRVIMEAMVLGKPVIGSNVGGIPDLIKDGKNGLLFQVGNSDDLAEKLRTLLNNRNLAMEMGQKGREFIQDKFSNEKYISSYVKMINL